MSTIMAIKIASVLPTGELKIARITSPSSRRNPSWGTLASAAVPAVLVGVVSVTMLGASPRFQTLHCCARGSYRALECNSYMVVDKTLRSTEFVVHRLNQQLTPLPVDIPHFADVARQVTCGDEFGHRALNGRRAMPVHAVLGRHQGSHRPRRRNDEPQAK